MWIWSAMARAKEFEKEQDEEAKDALDVRTSLGNGDHLEEKDWQNLSSDEAAVLEALDYMIILNRSNTKAEHENEIGARMNTLLKVIACHCCVRVTSVLFFFFCCDFYAHSKADDDARGHQRLHQPLQLTQSRMAPFTET